MSRRLRLRCAVLGHKWVRAGGGAPVRSVRCVRCGKLKVVDSKSIFNLPGP